jgi:hypothetical protein
LILYKIEASNRSLARRVRLNRAILTNKYWMLPVDDKGHEDFMPVGRGVPSSELCGKWMSFAVCKNVEGHEGLTVSGVDCSGKVVVRHKHMWCHKPTCPVCFNRGWSVRGARSTASRIDEGVNRGFGKAEHIVISVHPEDYDLPEKVLRKKSRLALAARGVIGGNMMFHGFRIDRARGVLFWSPHYHTLGFIKGGFDVCRDCVHERGDCANCSGFKGREVREYKKDKYIVKVLEERETIFGTAFYQLNHATVRVSFASRFHTTTWFGVCANRKYATPKVYSEDVCPVCSEEMVRCAYMGKRVISRNIGDENYKAWFADDEFDECGEPNYVEFYGSREVW